MINVSDKTNFNSNESILQKKLAESDFHVHTRTSRIRVYFFQPSAFSHNNHHILRWYEWGYLYFVNKLFLVGRYWDFNRLLCR